MIVYPLNRLVALDDTFEIHVNSASVRAGIAQSI
jgi:hypothetical protein